MASQIKLVVPISIQISITYALAQSFGLKAHDCLTHAELRWKNPMRDICYSNLEFGGESRSLSNASMLATMTNASTPPNTNHERSTLAIAFADCDKALQHLFGDRSGLFILLV